MELHALILSLLLLTIVVSDTDARSLETYKCATTCTEPENFQYLQGYTYQFSYAASVTSSFQTGPAAEQSSRMNIRANAMIDVLSPCEFVLRITNARIENNEYLSAENADSWTENLQRNPLHFNWQDGRIPDVCASNDDPAWVLNIKRGVLSALQVSSVETVDAIKETDVTGACESSYAVENTNGNLDIVKRKNYNKCEDRDKHLLFSHFIPYNSESPRQNFIFSNQTCTQRVVRNVIVSSECVEEHVFRPFSNEESGARTTIRQSLRSNGRQRYYSGDTLGLVNARRTNMVFEQESDVTSPRTDISEIQNLFSDLCSTMSGENYKQVGKDFIKMVFLLRRLDAPAIEQAYSSLNGACLRWETAMKGMFQDALQWCGSEGCVVFATRLIEAGSDSLPDDTASRWLTGMSLITKPTVPMLSGLMAVVQSGRLPEKSYLTAGTMIHRLCEASSSNCFTEPVVTRALSTFEDKLGVNCRTSNQDQKQDILLALRALGNAGRSRSINVLGACAQEDSNDMETRIAAVQSFRRMPCNTDRSAMNAIAFDIQQDAEIRIAAYMSVMKCPTPSLIQQIVILLDDEPVKQVASFIWSHVNQLLESNDPLKGYIKPLLLETEFAKKHDQDPRKYSRFYEASLFSEKLNAGATVESSVVWSPKSFVPRSAELDLTVDVFGQAVNLLEVGGRVEGLEKMIQTAISSEEFFLKNNPISQLFMGIEDDEDDEDDEPEELDPQRSSRATDGTHLVELRNQYRTNLNTEDKPNANWYLRVFGNEMYYQNSRSMNEKLRAVDMRSIFTQLAQGGEYQYHDDTMLVNSAHVLPTGIGLPLTIAFNGSASIDINANGNLDMAGLFNSPPNLAMTGSINPRAVILVTGSMSVDGHATKTGIATESAAITSWTMGGRASIENGRSVQLRIDTPYQRNTIFNFNHKLMKMNGDQLLDIGDEQANVDSVCTQEKAGQRLCFETPSNMLIFPVDGPLSISAHFEKTDTGFDHYVMEGTYNPVYTEGRYPSQLQATLRMDTPGSNVNRETNVRASYDLEAMQFAFSFRRPQTVVMLQGSVESEPNRKHTVITYVLNGAQRRFESTLLREIEGSETRWGATVSLETPSKTISGAAHASLDPLNRIAANLSIDNLLASPIIVEVGMQDNSDDRRNRLVYLGNGLLKVPGYVDTALRFDMNIKPTSNVFTFGLNYEINNGPRRSIHILHKRRDTSTSTVRRWSAEQKLTMTEYPNYNHHIQFDYTNGPGVVKSLVKFGYGRHAGHDDNEKSMMFNQTLLYSVGDRTEAHGNVDIQIAPLKVAYSAHLDHIHDSSMLDTNVRIGTTYGVHLVLQDNAQRNGLMNKELRLEVPTPRGEVRIRETIQETRRNVYTIIGELSVGEADGLSMRGRCDIANQRSRKSISLNIQGDNNDVFLDAGSRFEFLRTSGFNFENHIVSKYNNRVNVNVRYEGDKEGGFESSLLLEHQPQKYFNAQVDFEKAANGAKKLIRVDFKDATSIRRFIELNAQMFNPTVSNEENHFNASLSFTNNVPAIRVNSVLANVEYSKSLSTQSFSSTVNADDVEIIGIDTSYDYSVQRDLSALTSVSLNLRQGKCEHLPHSIAVSANARSTNSEGHSVTISYDQDREEKLIATIRTNADNTRLEADMTQHFDVDTVSENMRFVLAKSTNSVGMQLFYTRATPKTISLHITKNSPSAIAISWSQNDDNFPRNVPRRMEGTLRWGPTNTNNGKGIWFDATVDGYQPFNIELSYTAANEYAMLLSLAHQVRRFQTSEFSLPQLRWESRIGRSATAAEIRSLLTVDDQARLDFMLNWQSGEMNFRSLHLCEWLSSKNIPQKLVANVRVTRQSFMNGEMDISINVNDKVTTAAVIVNSTAAEVRYFSNCSVIAGHFDVVFHLPFRQGTLAITFTRDRVERHGTIRFNLDTAERSFTAHMSQNLYEDVTMPNFPMEIRLSGSLGDQQLNMNAHYNDYRFTLSSNARKTEDGKMILDSSYAQNIFDSFPDVTTHSELEIVPFVSVEYLLEMSVDEEPQMIKVGLYKDADDSTAKQLRATLIHNMEVEIPQSNEVILHANPLNRGFDGYVKVTMDKNVQVLNATVAVDVDEYSATFGMSHNISQFVEVGVFKNFTTRVYASPTVNEDIKGATFGGMVQMNDHIYKVDGGTTMRQGEYEQQKNINTFIEHNIMELYQLGLPLRLDADTALHYSVLENDLTGGFSLSSTIMRTMLNEEGEKAQVENHVHSTLDLQLFSWHAEFTASHDFDVTFIPKKLKYEISASGSTSSSHIFYKSLSTALTVDATKQIATITVNFNPTDQSFLLACTHNATKLYKYGIPGQMSVNFRRRNLFDFDLGIVYDTSKKSIGFTFDYHGDRNHLVFFVNHNFDVIVELLGLPKKVGIDLAIPFSSEDAEVELRYVWGPVIKIAHSTVRWEMGSTPSLTYRHHHNITDNDSIIPRTLRYTFRVQYGAHGFTSRVTSGSKYLTLNYESELNEENPYSGSIEIRQNFDTENYPRTTRLQASFSRANVIDASLYVDREMKIHTIVTPVINVDEKSLSLQVQNMQDYLENEVFPTNMNFYVNGSLGEGITSYASLARDGSRTFVVGFKSGYNLESRSAFAEFIHSQRDWKKYVPKKLRVDISYTSDESQSHHALTINVRRGKSRNQVTLGGAYGFPEDAMYARMSYTHDFDEYQETIPMSGMLNLLLEKTSQSISGQANVTLDEMALTHSFEALCIREESEVTLQFELLQDNMYLEPYDIPHTVAASLSTGWENDVAFTFTTTYGDKVTSMRLNTDKETRADLRMSHTWDYTPHSLRIVLSKPVDAQTASLTVNIDGDKKEIRLSGRDNDGDLAIHFRHEFEETPIPNEIRLRGNYQLSPNIYLSLTANMNGQEQNFAFGYNKLADGFHVTTTLLDDVTRAATLRRNVIPGGFSIELDHTIPELLPYLPGSFGVSANAKMSPRPNITASIRHQSETRMFTTEADMNNLRFALRHDFDALPIPRIINLELSGSSSPWQGSASLVIDGTVRRIRSSVDPQNKMVSLFHSIPELPLPRSLRISVSGSTAPLSAGISVTIDGIERMINAEFDQGRMRGRLQHSLPELDQLFVVRDIIVGVKGSTEPRSGEFYVSLDGLERRIGGSMDGNRGVMTLFHSIPEASYVPRNITIAVKGSLEPIKGSIKVTIDEVERSVEAEVNPRSTFAGLTHSIPEVEAYIPQHLSVSAGVTQVSGQFTFSFMKHGRNQSMTAGYNYDENHIRLQMSHNIENEYEIPSRIAVDISGSLQHKNATVHVSADDSFITIGGEIYTGDNEWYGASLQGQHNFRLLRNRLHIPGNLAAMTKVRKTDNTHEVQVNFNGLPDRDYTAAASITPTIKAKRTVVQGTYDHTYNGHSRSITASLNGSRRNKSYRLIVDGSQTAPERKQIRVTASASNEDEYEAVFGLDASHNIPELDEYAIPRRIENGHASFTIIPGRKTVRGEGSFEVDGISKSYSFDVRAVSNVGSCSANWDIVVDNGNENKAYAGEFLAQVTNQNSVSVSSRLTITNRDSGELERTDDAVFTATLDSSNPRAQLSVNQPKLNEYGFPRHSEIWFRKRDGHGINWHFHFDFPDVNADVAIIFTNTSNSFHLNSTSRFDQSITTLSMIPRHLAEVLLIDFDTSADINMNSVMVEEYNDYRMSYNVSSRRAQNMMSGNARSDFKHNIPIIHKYIGYYEMADSYQYSTVGNVYQLSGVTIRDGTKRIESYRFTYNLQNKEITYSATYDDYGYDAAFSYNYTKNSFNSRLTVNHDGKNLFNWECHYTRDKMVNMELANHVYGTPFEASYHADIDDEGYNARFNSEVSLEDAPCRTVITYGPHTEDSIIGRQFTFSHSMDGKLLNGELTAGARADGTAAKVDFDMTNKRLINDLPKKIRASANYHSLENAVISFDYGRKHVSLENTYEVSGESKNLDISFSNRRFNSLISMGIPQEIRGSFSHSPSATTSTVTVDQIAILNLEVQPDTHVLIIRDLAGETILSASGNYVLTPQKSIDAIVQSQPLNLDFRVLTSLTLFAQDTGNSSVEIFIVDNVDSQEFSFRAFTHPTSVEASDFLVGASTRSSFGILPFTINAKYNSTWDISNNRYIGDFSASYGPTMLEFCVKYAPDNLFVRLLQPWYSSAPRITFSCNKTINSEGYIVPQARIQWGDDSDSLAMKGALKHSGVMNSVSIELVQPSHLLGVYDCAFGMYIDFSQSETIDYGINGRWNGKEVGVNVSYTGVLPQVFGSHNLRVSTKQPFTTKIPAQSITTGIMSIASTGNYNSDWRITSQGREIAALVKHYRPTENRLSYDFLWRQSYYESVPSYLSYISTQGSIEKGQNGLIGTGSLQLAHLPEINANLQLRREASDSRKNNSVSVSVNTGPLSPWVKYRTVSFSSWFASLFDGREKTNSFSATSVLDGKTYHIEGSGQVVSSRRTTRMQGEVSMKHPMDLTVFGYTMPKETHGSLSVLERERGSRITATYRNDRMDNPLTVMHHYRFNNGDVLFELTTDMKYGPEEADNDMTVRMNVARNENGMDRTVTISMQYPERNINGELIIGGINTEETIGINAVAKDYSSDVRTWEVRSSLNKQSNIIEIYFNTPTIQPTTLRGDLSQVIIQGKQFLQRIAAEASNTQLRLVKGIETTESGYDLYIGYQIEDDATYTLHLVVGLEAKQAFAALQTKRNFVLETEVTRVSLRLANEKLIQLKMSANPVIVRFFQNAISSFDNEISRKINRIANTVIEALQSLKTTASGNEEVERKVAANVDVMIAKVNALRDAILRLVSSSASSSSDNFDMAGNAAENYVRETLTALLNMVDSWKSVAVQPFTEIHEQYFGSIITRITGVVERQLQPIAVLLRKVNAGDLLTELVEEATHKAVQYIMTNGEAFIVSARRPLSEMLVVTDTEVIFNIPLQIEVDHFVPLPTISDIKKWFAQSAFAITIDDAVNKLYSYTDEYYKARALVYIPRDEILPPFKGHSFVSGFRHFRTFDKRHFGFSSGCGTSHVLAADLRDGNFTVALSYADPDSRRSLNSLEVIVGNRHVIVHSDYRVEVNGRIKQLPLDLNLLSVMLEGNAVHVRRTEGDMDVACDFTKDLCTVDVSPFYFGSTAGLAGVYNNEPMDDFMSPTHTILDTPEAFAAAWEVSGTQCSSGTTYHPCASNSVSATCSALFKDLNSPLRSCFSLVDPEPFMNICRDDMCDTEDTTKSCAAAHAYAHQCKLVGALVDLPNECVVCSDASGNEFDASSTTSSRVSGVDVVLVIEQGSCMSQRGLYKSMRKFFKRLGSTLSSARMRNNRFHVVGYGGPGASAMPHTFTVKSNRFTSRKNDAVKALKKISLSTEQVHADAFGAISYASQLPFRAGAKPMIVLLSCDRCHQEDEVSYSTVESQLRKQGILLHHLPQKRISAGSNAKSIYGFDDTTVFTKGSEISSDVIKPSKDDMCVALATVTGGSVWDATQLSKSDFVNKLTRYVVNQAAGNSQQTCSCVMNEAGVPTSVCTE